MFSTPRVSYLGGLAVGLPIPLFDKVSELLDEVHAVVIGVLGESKIGHSAWPIARHLLKLFLGQSCNSAVGEVHRVQFLAPTQHRCLVEPLIIHQQGRSSPLFWHQQ